MIYRGPGIFVGRLIWLLPHQLSRQKAVSLSQSSCVSPIELTEGRVKGQWVEEEPSHTKACSSINHSLLSVCVWLGMDFQHYRAPICRTLRSPGIDSQPGGLVRQPYQSYRPARLQRLEESNPRNRLLQAPLTITNTGPGGEDSSSLYLRIELFWSMGIGHWTTPYLPQQPNSQFLTGGGIKLTSAWGCRTGPQGYIRWQGCTTTLCWSQLYPRFRDYEFGYRFKGDLKVHKHEIFF